MPQPPKYIREKNFTLDLGDRTDHSALNAEFDSAANSINDIRTNLAILQADDGKLRPSVVTPDSISPELRVSLVEGVIVDAQDMLNQSQAAAAVAEAAKVDAAFSSNAASSSAASALSSATTASTAATTATGAASTTTSAATSANADKTAAAASQTAAASSASNAQASATSAQSSATTASTAATTATTKASEASASASTATTKAAEASASTATATTKANEASTSASQAAASAASINPANLIHATGNETKAGVLTLADGLVTSSVNGGQLAGLKNKIINGKMLIAQRGASFPAVANGAYTLDKWQFLSLGTMAVCTVSQEISAHANNETRLSLTTTVTTADAVVAAGDVVCINQSVEGMEVSDLLNYDFTVAFAVKASKAGTYCMAITNGNSTKCIVKEYTIAAANTWERFELTFPQLEGLGVTDFTTGVGLRLRFTLMAGTTYQTATTDEYFAGNYLATTNQVNALDTIGATFAVTEVQLVRGKPTTFEHRPYGLELMLCQRYYQTGQARLQAYGVAASNLVIYQRNVVEMRATPSVVFSNQAYVNASGLSQTTPADARGFCIYAVVTAAGTAAFVTDYTLSAEL